MIPPLTPDPLASPTPIVTFKPTSERATIEAGLDTATTHAQALGATLGAVIIDLDSGVILDRNGDQSQPMATMQTLLIAIVTYTEIDKGTLSLARVITSDGQDATVKDLLSRMLLEGDNNAAKTLIGAIGGIDALNAAIRGLGYDNIVAGASDDGVATPAAVARVWSDFAAGHLLRASSRNALGETLAAVQTFPGRLRAGFPSGTRFLHETGTVELDSAVTQTNDGGVADIARRRMIVVAMLSGGKGTDQQRDAVLADVARAAATAAAVLNP